MNVGGIVLGQWHGQLLQHKGPEHVLLFAPTRSGKGVGLVIPTLLSIGGSVVVYDLRGEAWDATAGWRQRSSHCLCFNPTHPQSIRINPLLEVRRGLHEIRDVQNIADIVTDPEGAQDRRDYWSRSGHALLVGAILHVLYAEREKTLAGVATFLSDPQRSFAETLDVMMRTRHLGDEVHPVVASAARECLNKSPNELSGVLSTAMSFLGLYRDPIVAQATSASDVRLADLQSAAHPISLYLVVPPSDLSRTRPLMRLLLNQIGRALTEDFHAPRQHPLLLLLDEFPALGRLEFFQSALAYLAGYHIRAFLVAQSLNQLDNTYGPNNPILDNCHVRVAFAANDDRTAKRISDLLGTATEVRQQDSLSGGRFAVMLTHRSRATMVSPRALLTPGEVMQLPPDEALILLAGQPPIRAAKVKYYADPRFTARVLSPPDLTVPDLPPSTPSPWLREGPKPVLPREDVL
jgi:type IV secretion system protein VirD4